MSEAIANWLGSQQKLVEVSGRHAERVTLLGPDEKPWGVWDIKSENLKDQVEQTIIGLQEALPNGKHRGQLVIYDNKGDQWAAYPVVLPGRNTNAATAGQEARALQQATSIAIGNLEAIVVVYRNLVDSLTQQNELLREDNATLIETIQEFQTNNVEVELQIREHEERKDRLDKLAEQVAPVIQMLASKFGEKVIARAVLAQEKKEAKNGERKDGGSGSNGGDGGGAAGKPSGGNADDSADGQTEVSPASSAGTEGAGAARADGDSGGGGRGDVPPSATRSKPRARPLKAPLKPKAARARAARTKTLTRKGKKR